MNEYEFKGIINGFTLDENLIDGNVICDIEKQILCVSKKKFHCDFIDIEQLKNKKNLTYYEKFLVVLGCYLSEKPEYIIFKNMFCDFEYEDLEKVKILFRLLKKNKICRFVICSKNTDILLDLCDYVIDEDGSGEIIDVFKNKKNNIPFFIKFAKELEDLRGKKIGIYRNNVADLAKDVYRYVK